MCPPVLTEALRVELPAHGADAGLPRLPLLQPQVQLLLELHDVQAGAGHAGHLLHPQLLVLLPLPAPKKQREGGGWMGTAGRPSGAISAAPPPGLTAAAGWRSAAPGAACPRRRPRKRRDGAGAAGRGRAAAESAGSPSAGGPVRGDTERCGAGPGLGQLHQASAVPPGPAHLRGALLAAAADQHRRLVAQQRVRRRDHGGALLAVAAAPLLLWKRRCCYGGVALLLWRQRHRPGGCVVAMETPPRASP